MAARPALYACPDCDGVGGRTPGCVRLKVSARGHSLGGATRRLYGSVAAPVALRDRVAILEPVPGARILRVILRRVGRVEGIARPLDRHRLVHEAAVRAIEREALAPERPVVGLSGPPTI